jgi:hypothetical protein
MGELEKRDVRILERIKTQDDVIAELSGFDEEYQQYLSVLSPKQIRRAKTSLSSMKNGLYAVAPLICGGPERCLFFGRCPLPDRDPLTGEVDNGPLEKYPIGRSCIVERLYMQEKTIEYIQYLDVDPSNPIEMAIVGDLAIIDLYKYRAVSIVSSGDKDGYGQDFTRLDIAGFNEETGDAAYSTQIHPAMTVMDQLEKRREKLIDKLNETRKAKFDIMTKLGQGTENNQVLTEIAELRKAIRDIADGKVIDVTGEEDDTDLLMLEGAI